MAVIVQIDAYDPVAAAAVSIYAGSHDDPAVCHYDGQTWWPVLGKLPTLRYDLFDGAFTGQITAPSSSLSMQIEPWPNFGRYILADGRFRLWTGGPDAAGVWTLRFDGRVTGQPNTVDGAAQIEFAVDDRWLDSALLATYAGTTGAEGPAGLKGQAKPLAIGAPRYVPGKLVDSVNSVFQASAYGSIVSFDTAMERLARFSTSVGDYASYAALVAASIPAGRWGSAKAVGMARFGAPPVGQVSFLLQGDNSGADGHVRKPGSITRRIAALSGGTGKTDDTSLNALDTARPYNLSLYFEDQTTARAVIQNLAASVNAVAGVSWTGKLFVLPVAIGTATVTLASDGSALPPVARVEQIDIASPWQKLAITAERTWAVHALSDIAFTAELIDVGAYASGTTYREGNIVSLADGSRWLYTATTPTSGNLPASGSSFWSLYNEATRLGSNLVYDGGLALGGARWTKDAGWSVFLTGDVGWCAGISGPVSSAKGFYSDYFKVNGSTVYSLTLDWGGSGTVSFFGYVNWYNSSYGYISSSASMSPTMNVGFVRNTLPVTSPSGAAFGQIILLATSISAGGQVLVKKIKVEVGSEATLFNDFATNGAAYATGQDIDALKPGEIGANVTETRTAGAIAGQTAWATYGEFTPTGVAKPSSNLVYDGGLSLGGARWTKDAGWSVFLTGDVGWCAGISGPVSSGKSFYADYFGVYGLGSYTVSLDWGGSGTVSAFAYVNWYNSSYGYISSSASISPATGVGFVRDKFTVTSPSGAAFGIIVLLVTSITAGGQLLVKKIKCEIGATATPFNDDATNGAAYANGQHIDALKPGEIGANVTETRIAGGIAAQGALATLNAVGTTQLNANTVSEFTVTTAANPTFNSGTTPTVLSYTLSKPSETYLVRVTVTGTMRILGTSGTPTTNLQVYGRVNNGVTVFGRQDVNENVSGTTIFRQFNFTKSYPAASLTNGQAIEIYASLGATGGTYDVQFLYTEITVEFFKR